MVCILTAFGNSLALSQSCIKLYFYFRDDLPNVWMVIVSIEEQEAAASLFCHVLPA